MKMNKIILEKENSQSLSDTPVEFRKLFHKSISQTIDQIKPDYTKDWGVQVKDDELGIIYILYYFSQPTEKSSYVGFMVVSRVAGYDVEKNEVLPPENDKYVVFKFATLDELWKEN